MSVVPKQWLHDVVTGHKHQPVKLTGILSIGESGRTFQCNWHEQSMESPFTPGLVFDAPGPLQGYVACECFFAARPYSTEVLFSSLRGPPAIG